MTIKARFVYDYFINLIDNNFIKYGIGCLSSLIVKMALTNLLVFYFLLSAKYAYLLVNILLIFYSFTFHTKITFVDKISFGLFKKYCLSVLAFKLLDYIIFLFGITFLEDHLATYIHGDYHGYTVSGAILVSTIFIFMIRFVVYKKIFNSKI